MENRITPVASPTDEKKTLISISELFKKSWDIYRAGIKKLIALELVPVLGVIPLIVIFLLYALATSLLGGDSGTILIVRNIINLMLALVGIGSIFFVVYLVLAAQVGTLLFLENFSLEKKVFDFIKEAKPFVWRYFTVSLLTVVLVILWSLLLIIPGIIFAIYYTFANLVVVFEGKNNFDALRRSKELIEGYWWAVFGRFIAVWIFSFLVILIISIPLSFFSERSLEYVLWNYVVNAANLIIVPFGVIYSYFIYKDLVEKKNA